jgi:hypothetical protein
VLVSIKPVVASGEWSSPVDQDHPGEVWPGSWTSTFDPFHLDAEMPN